MFVIHKAEVINLQPQILHGESIPRKGLRVVWKYRETFEGVEGETVRSQILTEFPEDSSDDGIIAAIQAELGKVGMEQLRAATAGNAEYKRSQTWTK